MFTDLSGKFVFPGLDRRVLLRLRLNGLYDEVVAVDLHRPLVETSYNAGTVVMVARKPGLVRFTFGGDTMVGRRFVNKDEDGGEGEPEDLIHPDSRAEDAKSLFSLSAMSSLLAITARCETNEQSAPPSRNTCASRERGAFALTMRTRPAWERR